MVLDGDLGDEIVLQQWRTAYVPGKAPLLHSLTSPYVPGEAPLLHPLTSPYVPGKAPLLHPLASPYVPGKAPLLHPLTSPYIPGKAPLTGPEASGHRRRGQGWPRLRAAPGLHLALEAPRVEGDSGRGAVVGGLKRSRRALSRFHVRAHDVLQGGATLQQV